MRLTQKTEKQKLKKLKMVGDVQAETLQEVLLSLLVLRRCIWCSTLDIALGGLQAMSECWVGPDSSNDSSSQLTCILEAAGADGSWNWFTATHLEDPD